MVPKKSLHGQDNPKQKEQSWKHHAAGFQSILQGNNNQNSMVLLPKQRYTPMEHNGGLGSNTTHLQPSKSLTNLTKTSNGERILCLINGAGKFG